MTATREAPAEIENITGEFKGSVSKRGNFQTQQLEYTADDKWLGITAIAERYSRQSERRIELVLHRDIKPGTYHFEGTPSPPVVRVRYFEMYRIGFYHYLGEATTQKGTLVLDISTDNQHHTAKLDFTVKLRNGNELKLSIKYDVWLTTTLI